MFETRAEKKQMFSGFGRVFGLGRVPRFLRSMIWGKIEASSRMIFILSSWGIIPFSLGSWFFFDPNQSPEPPFFGDKSSRFLDKS